MNVQVLNRESASKRIYNKNECVISIYGSDEKKPNINGRHISLCFDDVDEVELNDDGVIHMNQNQANQIVNFVKENKDRKIYIHCRAGICRSSAVAQSILEWYYGIESKIVLEFLKSDRYYPNSWVRDKMRIAFGVYTKELQQIINYFSNQKFCCMCGKKKEYFEMGYFVCDKCSEDVDFSLSNE